MRASKTSFQLVRINAGDGKPPATLLRMSHSSSSSSSITLVLIQVHAQLCPTGVSQNQFRLTASKQRHGAIKALTGPDCKWMFKFGAINRHSSKVSVITLATAIQACRLLGVHPAALASLESLKRPGHYSILQTPEHCLSLPCTPSINPTSLLVPLPLPSNLPPSPISGPAPKQRYSLALLQPHLAKAVVVKQQLAELKTWATTPIQLNRKGPPLQAVSWQNLLSSIWLFLGFCWRWMGVQEPCLQHYLSPHLVAAFISFHMALGHCSSTIRNHVSTSLKVLAWWTTQPGGHDTGLQQMREEWLPNLSAQVGWALPKPTKTASALPSAKALLTVIHQQRVAVLAAIQRTGVTAALARALHDVALFSTIFGYLPPIRISCIRALVLPEYAGACHKTDCILGPSCHGNQLQRTSTGALHMQLPHHKNEVKWRRAAIGFNLPQDLAVVMDLYLSRGRKLLIQHTGQKDDYHVFVDKQGRPFTDSNLTIYWGRMLVAMGLGTPMPPSLCRQVFVHERRSAERAQGPSDRGAAMVMGHSVAQWSKQYDLDFHSRESQQAVDAMATWRLSLLSSASQPAQLQHTIAPLPAPLLQAATSPESGPSSPSQHHDIDDMDEGWDDAAGLDEGWSDDGRDDESGCFLGEDDDEITIDIVDF